MSGVAGIDAHLATGTTELCRCWRLTRGDGVSLGFTDHDRALAFEGCDFRPETGLSARTLSQSTGLAVDNTEAIGALSDAAITEADIVAGRYDGAMIEAWLVQWSQPENRVLQFRGNLGELTRSGGAFSAELRGLSERMNVATGRVYQRACTAVLGDAECGVDLTGAGFRGTGEIVSVTDGRVFMLALSAVFVPRWFERGHCRIASGPAQGLGGAIKIDRVEGDLRRVELWDRLRSEMAVGDQVQLSAGCDKRMETCRLKFANILNFRGFPDLPGDDWLIAHPSRVSARDGGSRR
ncbi:DUF2163 domain-containing protein [Roseicyclus sp.]|uniref:DUF2163 domain-containing protein n=1 Tax=Roseicyclus sp. TaxID=1914329 RepID=UPI003F6B21F5